MNPTPGRADRPGPVPRETTHLHGLHPDGRPMPTPPVPRHRTSPDDQPRAIGRAREGPPGRFTRAGEGVGQTMGNHVESPGAAARKLITFPGDQARPTPTHLVHGYTPSPRRRNQPPTPPPGHRPGPTTSPTKPLCRPLRTSCPPRDGPPGEPPRAPQSPRRPFDTGHPHQPRPTTSGPVSRETHPKRPLTHEPGPGPTLDTRRSMGAVAPWPRCPPPSLGYPPFHGRT